MSSGILLLTDAVEVRRRGGVPTPQQLRVCEANRFRPGTDLSCWNGARPDRPQCRPEGPQNASVFSAAGRANWEWIAALCRVEAIEGDMGREHGSPSGTYYQAVAATKLLAQQRLAEAGRHEDAEACRLSVRSHLAWDCGTALPCPRLKDEVSEGGVWRYGYPKKVRNRNSLPVTGCRWGTHMHGNTLTSEDSHADFYSAELATVDRWGLLPEEIDTMRRALAGDVEAMREVASWMYGVIDTPDTSWRWRLRRTTLGTESIYFGPNPSPNKPARSVTQQFLDGTHRGMRPGAPGARTNAGGYAVEITGGIIHASCNGSEAELPELGGNELWRIEVEGATRTFNGVILAS